MLFGQLFFPIVGQIGDLKRARSTIDIMVGGCACHARKGMCSSQVHFPHYPLKPVTGQKQASMISKNLPTSESDLSHPADETVKDERPKHDSVDDESPGPDSQAFQREVVITGQWAVLAQVAGACDLPRDGVVDAAGKGAVWLQKSVGKRYRKPVRLRTFDQVAENDKILVNYAPEVLAVTRAARGLIVIAHTKNAVVALADLFARRKVDKTYRAVVKGMYNDRLPVVIETPIDGRLAHTEVLSAKPLAETGRTELTIKIKTGRKHQIRSHLAQLGFPVVGDRLFDPTEAHIEDLQLVASELQFVCPFTQNKCRYVTAIASVV